MNLCKSLSRTLNGLFVAVFFLTIWACSGGAGTGASGPTDGGPGTALGPWMDEVAVGPKVDVGVAGRGVSLSCESPYQMKSDDDPKFKDADYDIQAATFKLSLKLYNIEGTANAVIRIVDVNRNEYYQLLTDSESRVTLPWPIHSEQNIKVMTTSLSAMDASSQAQACTNDGCSDPGMLGRLVCLGNASCQSRGFQIYPNCL